MSTIRTTLVFVALVSLGLGACKKDESKEPATGAKAGAEDTAGETAAAPAAALEWKKVGALGLEAEVPADASIDDNTAGAGFPSATIWASPTTFVHGEGDLSPLKPDMDGAKAEVQKDPNPFKTFTREEATDAGWHLEFELESMMDKSPIYGVQIRKVIDGKAYDCGSNTRSAEERAKVIAICNSLRKGA